MGFVIDIFVDRARLARWPKKSITNLNLTPNMNRYCIYVIYAYLICK